MPRKNVAVAHPTHMLPANLKFNAVFLTIYLRRFPTKTIFEPAPGRVVHKPDNRVQSLLWCLLQKLEEATLPIHSRIALLPIRKSEVLPQQPVIAIGVCSLWLFDTDSEQHLTR